MSTEISVRKLAANRENAKKSTGPRTAKGKAISAFNAMTHGVLAKRVVALGPPLLEEPAKFMAILEGLRAHWEPVGVMENVKVEEIAAINWKKERLERYETAGISERLSATLAAARSRTLEERWGAVQDGLKLGSVQDPKLRPVVRAAELREQLDLVERLSKEETNLEGEPDFLAFVALEKLGNGGEPKPEEKLVASLSPAEIEDLKKRFRALQDNILDAMWELRAKTVPDETAIERSLIPDEAEMNKIMRYSAHLNRLEEKAIAMLEKLQAARRKKEGRIR